MNSIEDVQDLFSKRLKELATENDVDISAIKVLIYFNADSEQVIFDLFVENKFKQNLRAKEDVLGIKRFDMLGKEFKLNFALGMVANALSEKLKQKHGQCEKSDVRVYVYKKKEEQVEPLLQVLKVGDSTGGEYITWEQLSELF